MIENRNKVRKDAESQKKELFEKVEAMKKRGNFDLDELAKMGINMDKHKKFDKLHLDEGSMSVNSYQASLTSKQQSTTVSQIRNKSKMAEKFSKTRNAFNNSDLGNLKNPFNTIQPVNGGGHNTDELRSMMQTAEVNKIKRDLNIKFEEN